VIDDEHSLILDLRIGYCYM